MSQALGLGLVAWSPLSGGVLTGKYNSTQPPTEARYSAENPKEFLPERGRQERIISALHKVSDETGRSLAQVALAWLRYRTVPVIPIIGARKISQLEDNLDSLSLTLTRTQISALDEASHVELGFPHDIYQSEPSRTAIYGGMRDRILT